MIYGYDLDGPSEMNNDGVVTYEFIGYLKDGYSMLPLYKCNNISITEKSIMFGFSEYVDEGLHHTPGALKYLTFAIGKNDLKKLLDELYKEQIDDN